MRQRRKPEPIPVSKPSREAGAFGRRDREREVGPAAMQARGLDGDRCRGDAPAETREGYWTARTDCTRSAQDGRFPSERRPKPGKWGLMATSAPIIVLGPVAAGVGSTSCPDAVSGRGSLSHATRCQPRNQGSGDGKI